MIAINFHLIKGPEFISLSTLPFPRPAANNNSYIISNILHYCSVPLSIYVIGSKCISFDFEKNIRVYNTCIHVREKKIREDGASWSNFECLISTHCHPSIKLFCRVHKSRALTFVSWKISFRIASLLLRKYIGHSCSVNGKECIVMY